MVFVMGFANHKPASSCRIDARRKASRRRSWVGWRGVLPLLLALVLGVGVPAAEAQTDLSTPVLDLVLTPPNDSQIRAADERRAGQGRVSHFAATLDIGLTPWDDAQWQLRGDRASWRVRVTSPGALSLSLAFGRFQLPEGGLLILESSEGERLVFDRSDNEAHGQLWTPPLPGDELLVELTVPVEGLADTDFELTQAHHGYAGFGEPIPRAGGCHRDVACSEGEAWSDAARGVALVSIAGVRFCSGFLVNNTALDGRPFFITARHCGIDEATAPSVVVMWNHRRPRCLDGEPGPEVSGGFQTGAVLRASVRASDTVLLELDDPAPLKAFFAGWDRGDEAPRQSVVIHHPNTGPQRISLDFDPAVTTFHLRDESHPRGNHLRVGDWESGSTEGGSSGAPLFNQDRRVVGQLHGGWAGCGNTEADWFGRFGSAWTGNGRPGGRLSDWLDPIGSDATVLDGVEAVLVAPSLDDLSLTAR